MTVTSTSGYFSIAMNTLTCHSWIHYMVCWITSVGLVYEVIPSVELVYEVIQSVGLVYEVIPSVGLVYEVIQSDGLVYEVIQSVGLVYVSMLYKFYMYTCVMVFFF